MGDSSKRVTITDGWILARWSDESELDEVRERLIEERNRLSQTRQTWMSPNAVAGGEDPRAAVEELMQDAMLTVADAIAIASARMLRRLSSADTAFPGEDQEQYAELEPMEVGWAIELSPVAGDTRLHFFKVPARFEDGWWGTRPIALCGAGPGVGGIDTRLEICRECRVRRDAAAS